MGGCAGLSPRVRGNHVAKVEADPQIRSIPACTGEPSAPARWPIQHRVYPRVYGGTAQRPGCHDYKKGLSPRVRGNPDPRPDGHRKERSIPACTGEPPRTISTCPMPTVYPRVYGGNPSEKAVASGCVRSIPACTGEPHSSRSDNTSHRVYPRVYGGTGPIHGQGLAINGLSPRVRGNPVSVNVARSALRSIPACTGEPTASLPAGVHVKVYPRVYGGTQLGRVAGNQALGLSPRVRGNLLKTSICAPFIRSIPACTGEPWTRLSRR